MCLIHLAEKDYPLRGGGTGEGGGPKVEGYYILLYDIVCSMYVLISISI